MSTIQPLRRRVSGQQSVPGGGPGAGLGLDDSSPSGHSPDLALEVGALWVRAGLESEEDALALADLDRLCLLLGLRLTPQVRARPRIRIRTT